MHIHVTIVGMNISFNASNNAYNSSLASRLSPKEKVEKMIRENDLIGAGLELPRIPSEVALELIREHPVLFENAADAAKKAKDIKAFVLKLVEIDAKAVAERADDFNLDEAAKMEVIDAIIKVNPLFISWYIEKFNLEQEEDRVRVFEQLFAIDKGSAFVFNKFEIEDNDQKIRLLKRIADKAPEALIGKFSKFNLDVEEAKEIVETIVEKKPELIPRDIDQFDESFHFFLLKKTIGFIGYGLKEVMNKAASLTESERFELAKVLISEGQFIEELEHFNISDEEMLFELLMLAAVKNGKNLLFHIKKFNLSSEEKRYKIACRLVELQVQIVHQFEDFNLSTRGYVVSVLNKIVDNPPPYIDISKFKLDEESDRFDFALKMASIDPNYVIFNLENLNIKDSGHLTRLAIRLIRSNKPLYDFDISKFLPESDEDLAEVAIAVIASNNSNVNDLLKFKFKEFKNLRRVFKALIFSDVILLDQIVLKLLPIAEKERFEIARLIVKYNRTLWSSLPAFKIEDAVLKKQLAHLMRLVDPYNGYSSKICDYERPALLSFVDQRVKCDPKIKDEKRNWYSEVNSQIVFLTELYGVENAGIKNLFKVLSDIVNPGLRSRATHAVFKVLTNKNCFAWLNTSTIESKLLLPLLITKAIFVNNPSFKVFESELLLMEKLYADGANFDLLLRFLINLYSDNSNKKDKIVFMSHLFYPSLGELRRSQEAKRVKGALRMKQEHDLKEEYLLRIKYLNLIVTLGCVNKIGSNPFALKELALYSKKLFVSELKIERINPEELEEKLDDILKSIKDETALLTYLGKINELKDDSERSKMKASFGSLIQSIYKGQFYIDRYLQSPVLKDLMDRKFESVIDAWKTGDSSFAVQSDEIGQFSLLIFLKQILIEDKHIPNIDKEMPLLFAYLNDSISFNEALACTSQVEKAILTLFYDSSLENVNKVQSLMGAFKDFVNDLNDFKKFKTASSTRFGVIQIRDTDNLSHLVLIGRQTGGCQNLDGNASTNKALLGYVLDGKNRIIGAIDEEDRLIGRNIFRMMRDKETLKPALFLERYYTINYSKSFEEQNIRFAIQRAKALKVPLYSNQNVYTKNVYGGSLESIGCNAPFEYSDAGGGMSEGKYEIANPYILYQPEEPKKEEG